MRKEIAIHDNEKLKKVETIFGKEVFNRVKEQLKSKDHEHSVCSGLVMYLLGLQESNISVSIDKFIDDYGSAQHGTLKAMGVVGKDDRGKRGNSNIVVYQHPFSGFPWHAALYLGEINGVHYEFGQWENGKPRFAPISDKQPLMFYRIEPK
ncbi:MAG: hypothetical protein H6772_01885 [Pseudomonadales bacterium]|nr:hypothetical protein [Pseudomonadales bacterium]